MRSIVKHIFILLLLCISYTSYAQVRPYRVVERRHPYSNNQNGQDRVKNIKVNFIRNQLNLPPDEARKFFPLYNEYQQELFNVSKLKRQNNLNAPNATEQINKELFYDDQILRIKMKFNKAFLKILSPDKVSELYKAEREFNDELVRSLSERSVRAGN